MALRQRHFDALAVVSTQSDGFGKGGLRLRVGGLAARRAMALHTLAVEQVERRTLQLSACRKVPATCLIFSRQLGQRLRLGHPLPQKLGGAGIGPVIGGIFDRRSDIQNVT